MDAGVTCGLPGEREVGGPLAAALAAGCRFAFAFGGCFGFARAALLLFGRALAGALLFGCALAGALLFGRALAGALLFGRALAGALLFGCALAAGFAFLGLPRFFGVAELRSARGTSGRASVAGFRVVAVEGRFTARLPLAGAARRALAGASRAPGVV